MGAIRKVIFDSGKCEQVVIHDHEETDIGKIYADSSMNVHPPSIIYKALFCPPVRNVSAFFDISMKGLKQRRIIFSRRITQNASR